MEGCDHGRGHGPLRGIDAVPAPQLRSLGHRVKENLQSGDGQATVPTSVHGSAHSAVCRVERPAFASSVPWAHVSSMHDFHNHEDAAQLEACSPAWHGGWGCLRAQDWAAPALRPTLALRSLRVGPPTPPGAEHGAWPRPAPPFCLSSFLAPWLMGAPCP